MSAAATSISPITAQIVDKRDGHGTQFELHLENGATPDLIAMLKSELDHEATLYLDGARVEGNNLILSLCRGSIVLAKVDNHWNSGRKDEKYHVIQREELDTDKDARLPKLVISPSSA
jgi:hypothetical protein